MLTGLGYIALHQGDGAWARGCFAEGLALCRETGNQRMLVVSLAGLARVARMQGQPERAMRLCGAAEALAELLHARPTAPHRIELERNVALTRVQLDEATFAAAWKAGRALSLEQAIADALAGTWPHDVSGLWEKRSPQPFSAHGAGLGDSPK